MQDCLATILILMPFNFGSTYDFRLYGHFSMCSLKLVNAYKLLRVIVIHRGKRST